MGGEKHGLLLERKMRYVIKKFLQGVIEKTNTMSAARPGLTSVFGEQLHYTANTLYGNQCLNTNVRDNGLATTNECWKPIAS